MGSINRGMCRATTGALGSAYFRRLSPTLIDSPFAGQRKILGGVAADFLLFALRKVVSDPGGAAMHLLKVASPSAAFRGWESFNASRAGG